MTIDRVTSMTPILDSSQLAGLSDAARMGPKLLFFSGGSALTGFCQQLKHYTHNSVHLVTPFDSGGSSAKLRQHFGMPAVGDLRSRLLALADDSLDGSDNAAKLLSYRLPWTASQASLITELTALSLGHHPKMMGVCMVMRKIIKSKLTLFCTQMPVTFDLRGASIGNLVLAGDYLEHHSSLEPCISLLAEMVNVRGTVLPIVDDNLHLGAMLQDGQRVLGQHNLTGKEVPALSSPIEQLFLTRDLAAGKAVNCQLSERNSRLIESADLICYPPGSFYSSLLVNLLPQGVGQAIAKNHRPKVFVPNLGRDPEQLDMTLCTLVKTLLSYLQRDFAGQVTPGTLLNCLLIDSENGHYSGPVPYRYLQTLGIDVIDMPLISAASAPYYDDILLVEALLSLR